MASSAPPANHAAISQSGKMPLGPRMSRMSPAVAASAAAPVAVAGAVAVAAAAAAAAAVAVAVAVAVAINGAIENAATNPSAVAAHAWDARLAVRRLIRVGARGF